MGINLPVVSKNVDTAAQRLRVATHDPRGPLGHQGKIVTL
jgi:hypothetical protein